MWKRGGAEYAGASLGFVPRQNSGAMDRLNLLDAIFLMLETAENPKHVGALLVFDRPEDARPDFVADLVARFRTLRPRGSVQSPAALAPAWACRPGRRSMSPTSTTTYATSCCRRLTTTHGLLEHVARMHEPLLDREMPLWEIHFIEGLAKDDRFAIYAKIHHACVDGVSGVLRIQASLHDDPRDRSLRAPWGDLPGHGRSHEHPSRLRYARPTE